MTSHDPLTCPSCYSGILAHGSTPTPQTDQPSTAPQTFNPECNGCVQANEFSPPGVRHEPHVEPACGVEVPIYGVAYGDVYEPCTLSLGHDGGHDPSVSVASGSGRFVPSRPGRPSNRR